jgi:cyclophilin family peptidyl-prolyl cis-trans isomerase
MAARRLAGAGSRGVVEPSGPNRRLLLFGAVFAAVMLLGVAIVLVNRAGEEPDGGAVAEGGYGTGECPPEEPPDEPVRQFDAAPQRCIEDDVDYAAVLTTEAGEITIDLLEAQAPITVNNFVVLARWRYYDGSTFHRVIPGFVVQGGDPVGDPPGTGGPGYAIPDELPEPGAYAIGSVAMANQYDQATGAGTDTGGSQFYIVSGPDGAALPPFYSLFGEVTDGLDVVRAIEETGAPGAPDGAPADPVTVESVTIVER